MKRRARKAMGSEARWCTLADGEPPVACRVVQIKSSAALVVPEDGSGPAEWIEIDRVGETTDHLPVTETR